MCYLCFRYVYWIFFLIQVIGFWIFVDVFALNYFYADAALRDALSSGFNGIFVFVDMDGYEDTSAGRASDRNGTSAMDSKIYDLIQSLDYGAIFIAKIVIFWITVQCIMYLLVNVGCMGKRMNSVILQVCDLKEEGDEGQDKKCKYT